MYVIDVQGSIVLPVLKTVVFLSAPTT